MICPRRNRFHYHFMDEQRAQKLIREEKLEGLETGQWRTLLAHELFHDEYRKGIAYYPDRKGELWKKPFSNRSRCLCLGRTKVWSCPLPDRNHRTPYVLDVLMMYGYDKEAHGLYEEIRAFVETAKERKVDMLTTSIV